MEGRDPSRPHRRRWGLPKRSFTGSGRGATRLAATLKLSHSRLAWGGSDESAFRPLGQAGSAEVGNAEPLAALAAARPKRLPPGVVHKKNVGRWIAETGGSPADADYPFSAAAPGAAGARRGAAA